MLRLSILSLALFLSAKTLFANTGEIYGFGSKPGALGNTMLSSKESAFTTYYNPALNGLKKGFHSSYGISYANPNFTPINNVTVSNNATKANTADERGDVDTDSYLAHFGHAFGGVYGLGDDFFIPNLALGIMAFLPIERLAYLDSGEPFQPEYFTYRSRTQRPQFYFSLAAKPIDHVYLGAGLAVGTNLSASVKMTATGSPNSVSHMRLGSTIKPSLSPYFGAYFDFFEPVDFGITFRLPNRSKVDMDTLANARVLGPTNELPISINAGSSIFFDPMEINLGADVHFTETVISHLEVSWYNFGAFEAPTMKITDTGSVFQVKPSVNTLPEMRNIIVPKIGLEKLFDSWALRGGYQYRQSPVVNNTGAGNLVDPEKHVISAGVGFDLKKANLTDKQILIDLHAQYHLLISQKIEKSSKNEIGIASQTKIGAPFYEIGGSIYAGGISVSMNF